MNDNRWIVKERQTWRKNGRRKGKGSCFYSMKYNKGLLWSNLYMCSNPMKYIFDKIWNLSLGFKISCQSHLPLFHLLYGNYPFVSTLLGPSKRWTVLASTEEGESVVLDFMSGLFQMTKCSLVFSTLPKIPDFSQLFSHVCVHMHVYIYMYALYRQCIYIVLIFIDRHWCCFYVFPNMNGSTTNTEIQVLFLDVDFISSRKIASSGLSCSFICLFSDFLI